VLAARGIVGGAFAPVSIDGYEVPVGPRYLELGYEDDPVEPKSLSEYQPSVGGHRGFTPSIRHFFEEEAGIAIEPVSGMVLQRKGVRARDFLFTVDLSSLPELFTTSECKSIAREALRSEEQFGRVGIRDDPRFAKRSLAWASKINHGQTFHQNVIEALGTRIAPNGVTQTLAPFARKIWLTVFHPRTLRQAASGQPPDFKPSREIFTPKGGFGTMMRTLSDGITASGGLIEPYQSVLVDTSRAAGPEVQVDGGLKLSPEDVVLATGPGESGVLPAVTNLDRFAARIVWLALDGPGVSEFSAPSLVHILDRASPAYRISYSQVGIHVFCLEYSGTLTLEQAGSRAEGDLRQHLPETEGFEVTLLGKTTIQQVSYSAANVARMAGSLQELHREKASDGVHYTGALSAVGADSLNEQVIQGLKIAETIIGRREL
jgi:hypothetical protein